MIKYLFYMVCICQLGFSQEQMIEPASIESEPWVTSQHGVVEVDDIIYDAKGEASQYAHREFTDNFQAKYSTSAYDYSMSKPRESIMDKIKIVIQKFLHYLFDLDDAATINQYTDYIFRVLAVGILGLVLYWIIRYFMKNGWGILSSKKNKSISPKDRTIKENIHVIDFNQLIDQFETTKQYRYAVRYQYLHLLKIFTDKGVITWDPDKTNVDYIKELKGSRAQRPFQRLTKTFEYVWYGEFEILEGDYQMVKVSFNELKNMKP